MNKPNIFKYATKELSQDAFILWLLDHANIKHENIDPELKNCALRMIQQFFLLENKEMPDKIEYFEISKQEKHIDIVLRINEYMIIIEDKTESKTHGNQLIRYKEFAEKKVGKENVLAIFFKTHDQSNYQKEEKEGFKIFQRSHLLDILQESNVKNDIFNDFKSYILGIEESVNSFREISHADWKKAQWIGFFKYLQIALNQGDWKYVANPSGGFMGFWWASKKFENYTIYLQLEKQKLTLKIYSPDSMLSRQYRNANYKYFLQKAKDSNLEFVKPSRFGSGKTMTILQTDYLNDNSDGTVDLDKTLQYLQAVTSFVHDNAVNIIV